MRPYWIWVGYDPMSGALPRRQNRVTLTHTQRKDSHVKMEVQIGYAGTNYITPRLVGSH